MISPVLIPCTPDPPAMLLERVGQTDSIPARRTADCPCVQPDQVLHKCGLFEVRTIVRETESGRCVLRRKPRRASRVLLASPLDQLCVRLNSANAGPENETEEFDILISNS